MYSPVLLASERAFRSLGKEGIYSSNIRDKFEDDTEDAGKILGLAGKFYKTPTPR
jgi:hypothetical protein